MRRHIGVSLFVFILFWSNTCLSQGWRWSSRLDFCWVLDNNVFESLSEPQTDHTGRFLIEISGRGRTAKSLIFLIHYQGGVEGYSRYSAENRMINYVEGSCEIPIQTGLSSGVTFQGRNKTFFNAKAGYSFYQASPFFRWNLPYGLRGSLFYTISFLNYARGLNYDYRYRGGGIRLGLALWSRLTWDLRWTLGTLRYDRYAFAYEKIDPQTYQWFDLGMTQKDDLQEISTTLEIYKWALIRIVFSYLKNSSNSYGYSYTGPKINVLAAKSLPWSLTLRFYWTLLLKNYTDSLQPLLQLRPDTENEENNFTLIDISKDLKQNLSLRFRMGWYQNESPFRDLYYEKNLISLGLTQRF